MPRLLYQDRQHFVRASGALALGAFKRGPPLYSITGVGSRRKCVCLADPDSEERRR
jgi:hypothetical protein